MDYCIALRAYAQCTRRQARGCRGNLVYHSAVFRIKELFSQHNCSSDGPTSSARAASTSRPIVSELCDYESRALASGQQKKYAHCGLFGDPHLRTFRDEFQTCKVEGAWPLIDNRYLSVQVTNVPVVLGSSATATSKVRTGVDKTGPPRAQDHHGSWASCGFCLYSRWLVGRKYCNLNVCSNLLITHEYGLNVDCQNSSQMHFIYSVVGLWLLSSNVLVVGETTKTKSGFTKSGGTIICN